jgi:hypothetical protein
MNAKNHSEFIRNHPKLSVADLIQEAAKHGLDIKKNLIYNVRSKDRTAAEGAGEAPARKKVSKKAKVAAVKAKKVSKKAKVAAVKAAEPSVVPPVVTRGPSARTTSGSKITLTVTVDVHDPAALKNSRGLISSLFSE